MSGYPSFCNLKYVSVFALAVLVGCTTIGDDSVLGSAANPASHNNPENPTQRTRLKNTSNILLDYCPRITLREGTDTYRIYKKGADRLTTAGVRFQATIVKTARECSYEQGQLLMKIGVAGRLINGPSGENGSFTMPLRIAIKSEGELVYSKLHQIDGTIAEGSNNGQFTFLDDQVTFLAPRSRSVQVFVGFDEGPEKTP